MKAAAQALHDAPVADPAEIPTETSLDLPADPEKDSADTQLPIAMPAPPVARTTPVDPPAAGATPTQQEESEGAQSVASKDQTPSTPSFPRPITVPEHMGTMGRNRIPTFPMDAMREGAHALKTYVLKLPVYLQVTAATVALVLLVGLLMAVVGDSDPARAYIIEAQPLLSGSDSALAPRHVGRVERGDVVELIATEESQALVRDRLGRVGYLPVAVLQSDPPRTRADEPFSRCRVRLKEDAAMCEARAAQQKSECNESCSASEDVQCPTRCDELNVACIDGCAGVVSADAPKRAPGPEPKKISKPEKKPVTEGRSGKRSKSRRKRRRRRK